MSDEILQLGVSLVHSANQIPRQLLQHLQGDE